MFRTPHHHLSCKHHVLSYNKNQTKPNYVRQNHGWISSSPCCGGSCADTDNHVQYLMLTTISVACCSLEDAPTTTLSPDDIHHCTLNTSISDQIKPACNIPEKGPGGNIADNHVSPKVLVSALTAISVTRCSCIQDAPTIALSPGLTDNTPWY